MAEAGRTVVDGMISEVPVPARVVGLAAETEVDVRRTALLDPAPNGVVELADVSGMKGDGPEPEAISTVEFAVKKSAGVAVIVSVEPVPNSKV